MSAMESSDINETIVAALESAMTAHLHELSARHFRETRDWHSLSLLVKAWHLALGRIHQEAFANPGGALKESTNVSQVTDLSPLTLAASFARAAQAKESPEYFSLWLLNFGRARKGWEELDEKEAKAYKESLREQWNRELEEDYRKKREELGVQRLSYEQRDNVREIFWAEVWWRLAVRAEREAKTDA